MLIPPSAIVPIPPAAGTTISLTAAAGASFGDCPVDCAAIECAPAAFHSHAKVTAAAVVNKTINADSSRYRTTGRDLLVDTITSPVRMTSNKPCHKEWTR